MKEKAGNIGFGNDEALMWAVSQGRRDALNALMDRYMPMVEFFTNKQYNLHHNAVPYVPASPLLPGLGPVGNLT